MICTVHLSNSVRERDIVRILYVLTTLGIGGAEKQVIDLAQRMASRGHFVALIVLKHADEEWPVKLPVMRLNIRKTPLGIVRGLRFAQKILVLFRPEILHSHTFPANIFARLLRLMLGGSRTAPVVINTIHNVHEGGWHRMAIYRITGPLARRVTAVSKAAAERFVRLGAISANKMSVLTNGIDTGAFTPDRSRRRRIRARMGAADVFVWLAVGRLVPAKDYPNLLRAWARVSAAHPKAMLWIAGEGDVSILQIEEKESISEASQNSGVHWLGLRRDIVELLDAADGYVLSSAWEGMPLALGEAMAMGKAVVATDVGGVRELVGDTGMIIPSKDSSTLAEEMLKVMGMGEKARRALGQAARQQIEQHFSMSAKADAWESLYAGLAKQEIA
jgi:glycosyltransferase involved in cell wall biosynthesis